MREIRIETRIRESRIKIICLRHVPTPVHKTVSRPMVDDNLYPGIEDSRRYRERESERERRNLHSSRSTRFRISPTRARGFVQSDFGLREGYSSPLFH